MSVLLGFEVQACCADHCRVWQETCGGKYPPSDHAPSCEHYKQESFATMTANGATCVTEHKAVQQMLADADDPSEYILGNVWLTRDQFDNLGDFAGF